MENNNQKQVAGKDATQIQAGTINIYNGISEERAREISQETMQQVLQQCSAESIIVAQQRINDLQDMVLSRIARIEKDFVSFSDPAFQVLYRKAQISAACSGRNLDYGMLSELIAHRINNKDNIKKKASIERAVEIIDKIDEDALCGLTMAHVISHFFPMVKSLSQALCLLNDLYEKTQYMDLPIGKTDWIDNLDILGAVRIQSANIFKKFEAFISESCNGYVACGIKRDSPQYEWAVSKLMEAKLPDIFLIENELLDGYVRIPVAGKKNIDQLQFSVVASRDTITKHINILLSNEQKAVLKEIFEKYDTTPSPTQTMKKNFMDKLSSYKAIKKAQIWWDQLNPYFQITSIGKAIAQANIKRIDQSLPDLD